MPATKQGKVEYTDQERQEFRKRISATDKVRPAIMTVQKALEYLREVDDARRNLTTEEVKSLGFAPGGEKERQALQAIRDSKKNEKRKGGPVHKNKRPQMKHGGVHKGKKHAYVAGGMVKDMKIMRSK